MKDDLYEAAQAVTLAMGPFVWLSRVLDELPIRLDREMPLGAAMPGDWSSDWPTVGELCTLVRALEQLNAALDEE